MMATQMGALRQPLKGIIAGRLLGLVLAILSAAACNDVRDGAATTPATHPSLRAADLPPLISAKEFYSTPKSRGHQLSPDGKKLAWIERFKNKPTLQVRELNSGHMVAMNHSAPATQFLWTCDSRHLVFAGNARTRRNRHLFAANIHSPHAAARDLTPFREVRLKWFTNLPSKPHSVLVHMTTDHGQGLDLYEINVKTGTNKLLQRNDGNTQAWYVSRTGKVVGRLQNVADGGWHLQARNSSNAWKTILTGTFKDVIVPITASCDSNATARFLTNVGRDKIVATALDWNSGKQEILFERPNVDVAQFWTDPLNRKSIAAEYHDPLPRYHFFDGELEDDLQEFLGPGPMLYRITSGGVDLMRLTIQTETDRSEARTHLIDRRSGKKELLSSHPMNKYEPILSKTRPIRFNARDGLPLGGYLTLPRGTDGKHLPMVLKVHGGPWLQDSWGFDSDTQFFANRGYAVLEVNFRGSSGFGKAFMESGRKESGRKIQDDLVDAVDWAVAEGYADPDNIAIYGHSYGGYAALVALTRTPKKFAAGIDVMGPSDLTLQVNTFQNKRDRAWWVHFFGNPNDPDEHRELKERSPVTYAELIERPLLIVHGARDTRVPKAQSDRFVAKLWEKGIPVEYLMFPDEGHHFVKLRNALQFAYRLETFLAKHLGGRAGKPD